MPTITEMAAKGSAKLSRKAATMASSYNAAKGRAVTNYSAVGFGPTRTGNYRAGIEAATYVAPIPASGAGTGQPRWRSSPDLELIPTPIFNSVEKKGRESLPGPDSFV